MKQDMERLIVVPGRGQQKVGDIEDRVNKAKQEIDAILKKYDVTLHGFVQFITPDVHVVPNVEE